MRAADHLHAWPLPLLVLQLLPRHWVPHGCVPCLGQNLNVLICCSSKVIYELKALLQHNNNGGQVQCLPQTATVLADAPASTQSQNAQEATVEWICGVLHNENQVADLGSSQEEPGRDKPRMTQLGLIRGVQCTIQKLIKDA